MAAWLVERRLSKTASRLKSLRSELDVIDEQLRHLGDDADDQPADRERHGPILATAAPAMKNKIAHIRADRPPEVAPPSQPRG